MSESRGEQQGLTLEQKARAEIEGAAAGACPYCEGAMDSFGGIHRKDCPILGPSIVKASPAPSPTPQKDHA